MGKLYEIRFPGGKDKVFTVSYDDGVRQDERLTAMMQTYGIKGTFNLNSGFLGVQEEAEIDGFRTDISKLREQEIAAVYEGQEIACHGRYHRKLTGLGTGVMAADIMEDRKALEAISRNIVNGFAYPFGLYDQDVRQVLKVCEIAYARTVVSTGGFDLPEHFLEWHPTCHHNDPQLMELARQFCEENAPFAKARLFYVWGHSYEFDQRQNWAVAEQLFAYIAAFREDIWLATNGEIASYTEAYRSLKYSADARFVYNPSAMAVWVWTDGEVHRIGAGERYWF